MKGAGIRDDTRDVFLECAYFSPDAIVGTPRLYGLQTDASLRYERGVDPDLQFDAIERATRLLCEVVGGEPGPVTIAESSDHIPSARNITLRKDRLATLIGEKIAEAEVEDVFTRLGFDIENKQRELARWCSDVSVRFVDRRRPSGRSVPSARLQPDQCSSSGSVIAI